MTAAGTVELLAEQVAAGLNTLAVVEVERLVKVAGADHAVAFQMLCL